MNDSASKSPPSDPRRRDEWTGIHFLLGEMVGLRERGLVSDEAYRTIIGEYSRRRDGLEMDVRFEAAVKAARDLAVISPREALAWANRARELGPDRPEGWVAAIQLLRKMTRGDEADALAREAARKFPDLARLAEPRREADKPSTPIFIGEPSRPSSRPALGVRPAIERTPSVPTVSWAGVAGEFLEEHWQKLISGLAVLLIVVSSTVGANLVLGPLLWSPAGKGILALVYTSLCAGFGVGLVRWGAERAGRMILATTLILIPINLMLAGELGLLARPSSFEVGLVAADALLLFLLARGVVSALGLPSGGTFTAAFFALVIFNVGASRGMPFEVGFPVFLAPAAVFLGAVAWLNGQVRRKPASPEEPVSGDWLPSAAEVPVPGSQPEGPREGGQAPGEDTRSQSPFPGSSLDMAYLQFGLLAFGFLSGVIRTGGVVLHLVPCLYAIPAMLAAIAGISTARAIEPIEKDRQRMLMFLQGGLALSALAFALALARPTPWVPSALYSGNTLAVASLGLALYATSLRATRKPAYLYCGFAALFLGYFGAFYFAKDLVRAVEETARHALGYDRPLPMPFKAINGLVFNMGLVLLARFFARKWSDDGLARHCHYIGLPLSIAACIFSGFEPKAAVICLGGYAILYAIGTRMFDEPRLIYLACSALAGSAFFWSSLAAGTTLGLRSVIASALGLVFWAIRATPPLRTLGETYRTPLIRSARVMAGLAMIAATAASVQDGLISPLATVAFLLTATLALFNGHESPRVSVYLLAIAALLGSWLGGYHLAIGGQPSTAIAYGLVIAGFALAVLLTGEAVRGWFGHSDWAAVYVEAIGWAVPVVVLLAWVLAGSGLSDSVTVARTFLVGSSGLLWLTRFRRDSVLVYLGLAGLATWLGCLCGLVVPWDRPGIGLSWLAITWGGCSLGFWGVGEWVRRRGDSFYERPCFLMAGVLAAVGIGMAFDARWASADSYRLGVAAMLEESLAFALIAASRRWPASVALASASIVGAIDLALLSQGRALAEMALWLGMASAAQAIACRAVGWWVRRASGEAGSPMARPLDFAALALLIASIPLGYRSPTTLLLIAATTLLMIGCFRSNAWLYGTFLAVGSAIYHPWLAGYSVDGLIPFVIVGAFVAWGIGLVLDVMAGGYVAGGVGLALRRVGPGFFGRLGVAGLRLEDPPVKVAMVLGVLASVLRIYSIGNAGESWASLPWLPWALAGLCLLMLRFEPYRGWAHAAVGLTGLGFAATLASLVEPRDWWLSEVMALASFWAVAGRGAGRFEGTFRRRLGMADGRDSGVVADWSLGSFGLASAVVLAIVVASTLLPSYEVASLGADGMRGWLDVLLALGFAGLFVALEGRRLDRDGRWIGFEALAILAVWWLGAAGSPLMSRLEIHRATYLPLATAACSIVVVVLGQLAGRRQGVTDPSEAIAPARQLGLHEWTRWFGFGLGLASSYLAVYSTDRVALLTLILATVALGWLALGWREVESAYAGGVIWCLAWSLGLVVIDRTVGLTSSLGRVQVVALGLVLALFGLWTLAGWVRGRGLAKGGDPVGDGRVASALEWVAIGSTIPSALLSIVGGPGAMPLLGSGLLFALAVFYAMVAARRLVEWPVYLAQALLLACYFRARGLVAPPGGVDAVVLSLLAYLDLGLSELMTRLRLSYYARPTFRFAMVLPLIPVIQGAWLGRWDGVDLFILLATALFYALTSVKIRSKTPAYAAAVFFNAFLWLAWYQFGWTLGDRPQFYLIPVGFSSILFAEVNRRELSRSVINGARNLGLVVIYASLASPIWQTQSFGAWLALLLLSLAGIFVGIGLRIQSFLWLGMACFVADLAYQLGRLGMEHALARWGVMLSLGVVLILFVALNEKKRIVATMRQYYEEARTWE